MVRSARAVMVITGLAAVVFVGSAVSVTGLPGRAPVLFVVLVAANTLPLLAVRWNPLAVVATFSVAYPLWVAAEYGTATLQSLPTLVAMFAAGAWERPLALRATALLAPAWMMAGAVTGLWDVDLIELGYVAVVLGVVWLFGVVVARVQADARELQARTAQLEAARRELADRAVADERVRIARELHDVIAHAMSVITVQAGVGAHLARRGSDQAVAALDVIERVGREALAEMRRMLTVLRDPDPDGPRPDPQPGLADLPSLLERTRAAGVLVRVEQHGDAPDLPPGLDLAAYRVVQEALTNVVKHASSASADVRIRYRADEVQLDICNETADAVGPVVAGQGLRGMAERVALYEGSVRTVVDDGVFRVGARLPVPPIP